MVTASTTSSWSPTRASSGEWLEQLRRGGSKTLVVDSDLVTASHVMCAIALRRRSGRACDTGYAVLTSLCFARDLA